MKKSDSDDNPLQLWPTSAVKREVFTPLVEVDVMNVGHSAPMQQQALEQRRMRSTLKEKRRNCEINSAFNSLQKRLPLCTKQTLPKVKTLRLACKYIEHLSSILDGNCVDDFANVANEIVLMRNDYRQRALFEGKFGVTTSSDSHPLPMPTRYDMSSSTSSSSTPSSALTSPSSYLPSSMMPVSLCMPMLIGIGATPLLSNTESFVWGGSSQQMVSASSSAYVATRSSP